MGTSGKKIYLANQNLNLAEMANKPKDDRHQELLSRQALPSSCRTQRLLYSNWYSVWNKEASSTTSF